MSDINKYDYMALSIIALFGVIWMWYGAFGDKHFGFGDETYYALASRTYVESIIEKHEIPLFIPQLYSTGENINGGEWLAKPVLCYLIPAIWWFISGGRLMIYKTFAPIFAILTLVVVYEFCRYERGSEAGLFALSVIVLAPLFTHFSVIAYMDIPFTFFYTLALLMIWVALKTKTTNRAILAGICLGFTLLSKQTGLLMMAGLVLYKCIELIVKHGRLPLNISEVKSWIEKDRKEIMIILLINAIGIAMVLPWYIRNTIHFRNPFFPDFAWIGGYYRIDVVASALHQSAVSYYLHWLNPIILWSYFGYMLLFGIFGILYALYTPDKQNIYLLTMIASSSLIFIVSPSKDIRYLMNLIPALAIIFAFVVWNLIKEIKHPKKTWITVICIIAVVLFSANMAIGESNRISEGKGYAEGSDDAYDWIIENTPKDAVIYDLYTPNCLFYLEITDKESERTVTFPHPFVGGEIYHFWEYEDGLKRIEKHNITYIVTPTFYWSMPEELRYLAGWTHIPLEFVEWAEKQPEHFNLVYQTETMYIFEVYYNPHVSPYVVSELQDDERMKHPADIIVKDGYAYVSTMGGVSIVNVTDTENPEIIGYQQDYENISDMVVSELIEPYIYSVSFDKGTFVVVDVSDKTNPQTVSTLHEFKNPVGTHRCGDNICVTDFGANSTSIIDVSNPPNPVILGTFSSNMFYQPQNFIVEDEYLYATMGEGNGLAIIDLHDQTAPKMIGRITSQEYMKLSDWLCKQGNVIYVLSWGKSAENSYHVAVVDVEDKENPELIAQIPLKRLPSGINCKGNNIVFLGLDVVNESVADAGGGGCLEVVNVDNPRHPRLVYTGCNEVLSNNYFNVIEGNYMYLTRRANNTNGFVILYIPEWMLRI